jgi:hypothetical protein
LTPMVSVKFSTTTLKKGTLEWLMQQQDYT